jgi:hypothetical protein
LRHVTPQKASIENNIMSFLFDTESLLEAMGVSLTSSVSETEVNSAGDDSSDRHQENNSSSSSSSHFDVLSEDLNFQSQISLQTGPEQELISIDSSYFVNGYENDDRNDQQTIISSTNSSAIGSLSSFIAITPAEFASAGEQMRFRQSNPHQSPLDVQSLSTVSSQSTFLINEDPSSMLDDLQSVSLISRSPSEEVFDDSSTCQESQDNHAISHHPESFVNVANQLIRESSTGSLQSWYKYFTDRDWQTIQIVGEALLGSSSSPSLSSSQPRTQLVLPHPTTSDTIQAFSARSGDRSIVLNPSILSGFLPDSCICKFCGDTVVGAFTLDCPSRCTQSVVCSSCWVEYVEATFSSETSSSQTNCPGCASVVSGGSPCHALDVAILQIMNSTRVQENPNLESAKDSYFARLNAWNESIIEHQDADARRKDIYLAQLLEEEEAYFYNHFRSEHTSSAECAKRNFLLDTVGQVAVGLIVGALAASFGFSHIRGKPRVF